MLRVPRAGAGEERRQMPRREDDRGCPVRRPRQLLERGHLPRHGFQQHGAGAALGRDDLDARAGADANKAVSELITRSINPAC